MYDLIKYLPRYYQKSVVIQEIMRSFENELNALNINIDELAKQFFVYEADKELAMHEQDMGLSPNTAFPIETRRGRVLSRLRGTGTVTKEMLRNIVKSFVGGSTLIIEEYSKYLITIKFIGYRGIPDNIESIKLAIGEVQPAHLVLAFEFTYAKYSELKQFTHKELAQFSHKKVRLLGGETGG